MSTLKAALVLVALLATPAFAGDPCTDPANTAKANDALVKARAKDYTTAMTEASAVLAACPTHAVATRVVGQTLVAQKLYDEAVTRMTGAIAAKKDQAYAYLWRGYAYSYQKKPDKTVEDFQIFLKLAPSAPEAPVVKQYLAGLAR
jgi:tetratricopeptide (TPR) repeat protein